MESKILNFPDAMRLSDLIVKYGGKYLPEKEPKAYIVSALSEFTEDEISWVRDIFSPNSVSPIGQLEEICLGVYSNRLMELCSIKEAKC